MNICRLLLCVGLAVVVAAQEKCDENANIVKDLEVCEGCENNNACCTKEGEDGKTCHLIKQADAEDASNGERSLPFQTSFTVPQFSNNGMHAVYGGNYLAKQTLLATCARETFPYVCQRKQMYDYTFKCPLNIPYCQRIPCVAEDSRLDNDIQKCLSKPGCCFDQSLAYHRRYYGNAILPGVPVCHLAVRNSYFQKEAYEYVQKYRGWNPLLTSCLIDSYKDYIYMNKRTCDGIKALEYFGFKAKLAGWTGITEQECLLIGGCWRAHLNRCNYEPKSTKLSIRSAQGTRLPKKWTPQQIYGQPKCLDLDYDMEGKEFLTSLHYCLASGCSIDPSISLSVIHRYMQNVSAHLPGNMANLFRHEFNQGVVSIDNFQNRINYYHTNPQSIYQQNQYSNNYLNTIGNSWFQPYYKAPYPTSFHGHFTPIPTYANQMNENLPYYARELNGDDKEAEENTWDYGQHVNMQQIPPHPKYPFPVHHSGYGYGQMGQAIYGQSSLYHPYYRSYCPFKNPQIPGLPPLQGKFEGCCDRPLCYMNRDTVTKQFSGAATYYRPWSSWSPCSVTCGVGTQTRIRRCIGVAKCEGRSEETKKCQGYYHCAKGDWKQWGRWSSCGRGCTNATRTRVRVCPVGKWCSGPSTQTEKCRC